MLIAELNGARVDAEDARRGDAHVCPSCREPVILRRGRKVIAHFAHRAEHTCRNRGETRAHLQAKRVTASALRVRDLRAEIEYVPTDTAHDIRADVMVWPPDGGSKVAIEFQQSAISVYDLEARALAYAASRIAQFWVPFLRPGTLDGAETHRDHLRIDRYQPHQYEMWIAGLTGWRYWMWDPEDRRFWQASLAGTRLTTPDALWYGPGSVKNYRPAKQRLSRRYRALTLRGPFDVSDLRFRRYARDYEKTAWFEWPEAMVAEFVPRNE